MRPRISIPYFQGFFLGVGGGSTTGAGAWFTGGENGTAAGLAFPFPLSLLFVAPGEELEEDFPFVAAEDEKEAFVKFAASVVVNAGTAAVDEVEEEAFEMLGAFDAADWDEEENFAHFVASATFGASETFGAFGAFGTFGVEGLALAACVGCSVVFWFVKASSSRIFSSICSLCLFLVFETVTVEEDAVLVVAEGSTVCVWEGILVVAVDFALSDGDGALVTAVCSLEGAFEASNVETVSTCCLFAFGCSTLSDWRERFFPIDAFVTLGLMDLVFLSI